MDFGGTELVIGKDGTGGVVFTTGDPTAPYETSSLQSMGNLINMSQQMFIKYDAVGDITAFVDEIGAVTQGNIRLNETSEQFNAAYQPAKEDFIASIIEDPYKLQSMASDYIVKSDIYDRYTTDQSKVDDPNALVFINQDGYLIPDMDSKGWQDVKAKATEFLSDAIDVQTTKTMEFKEKPRGQEKPKRDQLSLIYQSLDDFLATGNPASLNAVASATGLDINVDDSGDDINMTVGAQGTSLTRDGGNREQLFASIATQVGAGQYHNEVYRRHAGGSYSADNMSGSAKAPKTSGSGGDDSGFTGVGGMVYLSTFRGTELTGNATVGAGALGVPNNLNEYSDDGFRDGLQNMAKGLGKNVSVSGGDGSYNIKIDGEDYPITTTGSTSVAQQVVDIYDELRR
jgi:hypothetical protein